MNLFTFNIFKKENKELNTLNGKIKKIGNYYYIQDGDNYINNEGKIDRDKLKEIIEYN